ncbi:MULTISPECIES: glycosyltransferase [Pseudomonas]|uniref:Glycosyltransferase, GT2 family n=1 Tax=Pseudomonas lutea TaxID=243924 RepID=A0A9X8QJD4_9PSED|nr:MULTISPECIES: glycosyltransferase [Pseudomonas]SEQ48267.1 Glycosyltransferase, GT2 family [Pseudomonas lutea]
MINGETIGCAIVTYNRPDSFLRLYNSIPKDKVDYFIVVNDGKYHAVFDNIEVDEFVHHEVNKGVGASKNDALSRFIERGIDHVFLIEDDIYITDHAVFEEYIKASKISGIEHLNYSQHGVANKIGKAMLPNPKAILTYRDVKIPLYGGIVGAFSYYSKRCLEAVGLMDSRYYNALEHVDHTYEIIKADLHPPYWYFADIDKSWDYFGEDEWSQEQSTISGKESHLKIVEAAAQVFIEKHGCTPKQVPDVGVIGTAQALKGLMQKGGLIKTDEDFYKCVKVERRSEFDNIGADAALRFWLSRRAPTVLSLKLVEKSLQESCGGPRFGIFVLDRDGNINKIIETLQSLNDCFYQNFDITVLSPLDLPKDSGSDGLRFIKSEAGFINHANREIVNTHCDWVLTVQAGETFTPFGLLTMAQELIAVPDCQAVYADSLHKETDGSLAAAALRPAFSLDYFLSYPGVMATHWLMKKEKFIELGGFDPAFDQAYEFDLLTRFIESNGLAGIGHVDEALLSVEKPAFGASFEEQTILARHLVSRGYEHARVLSLGEGRYRVIYGHEAQPLVSIVIAAKTTQASLERCLESLLSKTSYTRFELLIGADASCPESTVGWLSELKKLVLPRFSITVYDENLDTTVIRNQLCREAKGDYVLLLSADVEIIQSSWLDEMLNHALRPEVGIVGAKVLFPTGLVRHAGMILGLRGPVGSVHVGEPANASGYMERLVTDQNYSVVSSDCMLVRRSVYEQVEGQDEAVFKAGYADIDLCLKIKTEGYLTVWTPHALMTQWGADDSRSNNYDQYSSLQAERHALYEKWLPLLARDTAYNQNLSLDGFGFELAYEKAREWSKIGTSSLPRLLVHPSDSGGCGHYRHRQPFRAMQEAMLVDGAIVDKAMLSPVELERFDPDVILYQRQFTPQGINQIEEGRYAFSKAFRVIDMDDYYVDVPKKSIHRNAMPKDVDKLIQVVLDRVDRFVASTAPLADAFSKYHRDIRVMPNYLPVDWWGNLKAERRVGPKPRVGWIGGTSHTGDLELLVDVLKELADEVDWIFMGMCPEKLRPYIKEFHKPVPIEPYPEKMASLNLDLALAPLEQNRFNECKTNLRLLEYGACGFPVICTDIVTFRSGLPVTFVQNETKAWVDAIRMHLSDMDATAKAGDALREAVLRDWMLNGSRLEAWRDAWLPD